MNKGKQIVSNDKPLAMTLRLPSPMWEAIRSRARVEMLSVTEWIRRAIFEKINKKGELK